MSGSKDPRRDSSSARAASTPIVTSPAATEVGATPCPNSRGSDTGNAASPPNALTTVVVEPISATRASMRTTSADTRQLPSGPHQLPFHDFPAAGSTNRALAPFPAHATAFALERMHRTRRQESPSGDSCLKTDGRAPQERDPTVAHRHNRRSTGRTGHSSARTASH